MGERNLRFSFIFLRHDGSASFLHFFLSVLALGTLGLSFGCATPSAVDPGRAGLFDEWGSKYEPGRSARERIAVQPKEIRKWKSQVKGWAWPLKQVEVTSVFGKRGRKFHEGIDLRANVGTPVYAASKGKVVYSGNKIGGYGHLVVIRHENGFFSIYAHNSKILVREGFKVERGQRIALSGRSGKVTGPHLHFEIRKGTLALDPMSMLEGREKRVLASSHAPKNSKRVVR